MPREQVIFKGPAGLRGTQEGQGGAWEREGQFCMAKGRGMYQCITLLQDPVDLVLRPLIFEIVLVV